MNITLYECHDKMTWSEDDLS